VIARADDPRAELAAFREATFAFNDPGSQSGWAALAAEAPDVLAGPCVQTGSHRASTLAVARAAPISPQSTRSPSAT
jgi:ABC-type phosphate/phosphonate transport system substrate-binding protein